MLGRARGLEEPKTPKPCKLLRTAGFQHSAGSSGGGFVFLRGLDHPVGQSMIITHRRLSSSFLGLPYRVLNMNLKKELLPQKGTT